MPPRFTDPQLNTLLKEIHPQIRPRYYVIGNSDFYSFLAKGFRAGSLSMEGDARAGMVVHTERDTIAAWQAQSTTR